MRITLTKRQRGLMQKWVDALTSRKYKQGKGSLLHKKDGKERYCCLGVLCDVCHIKPKWDVVDEDLLEATFKNETGFLPKSIQTRIGLVEGEQDKLAEMNDKGVKFGRIARYLKRKYLS